MNNHTIDYYNNNADAFIEGTQSVDFTATQEKFLKALSGTHILDFGCGSGRDTKFFLEQGLTVDAIDGSEELCKSASQYTGIPVKCMLFQDLDEENVYDGIWACASILHLPKAELKDVLKKMAKALVPGGVVYTSFKYGDFEGERNGRYFSDFTMERFAEYMIDLRSFQIEESWITSDVRPGREAEKWLNLILRKPKN